jgi:hypothetical protein
LGVFEPKTPIPSIRINRNTMKQETVDAWIKRAEEVLQVQGYGAPTQLYQFSLSLLTTFYGPTSVQLKALKDSIDSIQRYTKGGTYNEILSHCNGVITATLADIRSGLVNNARAQMQGEVLGDLVAHSKEALDDKAESATHVAAVLIAAAFEDVLRRLAAEKAALTERPKLEQVIAVLKEAEVIKGGEISTANSYLKFRNDSLHAHWEQVHRFQVESCIAFVESLLLKHFS